MSKKPTVREAGNHPFPTAYYGLADELDFDDKRLPQMVKDRQEKGFDETELWNLDLTMMKFILPRLIRFRESTGHSEVDWLSKIDLVISGFKLAIEDCDYYSDRKNQVIVQNAVNTLAEIWMTLWN